MNRRINIFITALLVGAHAFLVPAHIAKDHVHSLLHDAEHDALADGASSEANDAHGQLSAFCCDSPAACVDTSGFDSPYHHCAHAHSSSEQGLSRNRGESPQPCCKAVSPILAEILHQPTRPQREGFDPLPRRATCVAPVGPRGPPVC